MDTKELIHVRRRRKGKKKRVVLMKRILQHACKKVKGDEGGKGGREEGRERKKIKENVVFRKREK